MSDVGSTFVTLKPLPLAERRAVGGPVSRRLLTAYFAVALAGWLALMRSRRCRALPG
jgi:hypothetical protein